jgi:hypothetical protein
MPLLAAIPHFIAFFGTILFGCAILLAVRILAGDDEGNRDMLHQTLRRVAWLLILAGVLAVLLAAGVIPAVVAIIVFPTIVYRRRRAHRYALAGGAGGRGGASHSVDPGVAGVFYGTPRVCGPTCHGTGGTAPGRLDTARRRGLRTQTVFTADRLALRMGHDSGNLPSVLRDVLGGATVTISVEAQIFWARLPISQSCSSSCSISSPS